MCHCNKKRKAFLHELRVKGNTDGEITIMLPVIWTASASLGAGIQICVKMI